MKLSPPSSHRRISGASRRKVVEAANAVVLNPIPNEDHIGMVDLMVALARHVLICHGVSIAEIEAVEKGKS